MLITKIIVVEKIRKYLNHQISLAELVSWAEDMMQEADFEESHYKEIRSVIANLGLSDVKEFGLTWEDCEKYLSLLGFKVIVELQAFA